MVRVLFYIIFCSHILVAFADNATIVELQKKVEHEKNLFKKSKYLSALTEAYITASSYQKATSSVVKLIQIAQQHQYDSLLYTGYIQLGRIFFYQKNFEKSKLYYKKALALDSTNKLYMANYHKQNGDIFIVQNNLDSAKIFFEIAQKFFKEIHYKDSLELAKFYANYSILFDKDFINRLDYALMADKYFNKKNENNLINKGNIGNTYKDIILLEIYDSLSKISPSVLPNREGNFKLAYSYVHEAIAMAHNNGDKDNEAYFTGILSEIQAADYDYRNAYYNIKSYYEAMDSIYSQENKNTLANLESKIEIDKKNAEIATQKKLRLGLIIGLLLLGIIIALLYFQAKNRKSHNTKLTKLNEQLNTSNDIKTKLFGIISHDLRSPIAQLVTFLQLENTIPEEQKQLLANQKIKVLNDAENLLSSMETMLLWSKGQMHNFSPQKKDIAVEDLFEYQKRFFSTIENIQISYQNHTEATIYTDENFMQIIMQNLSSNAIKATKNVQNASITWSAYPDPTGTILQISDNGPGMATDDFLKKLNDNTMNSDKSGLGLHIINDLAKAIDVQIEYITDEGKGFTAKIFIINSYYCIGYTY